MTEGPIERTLVPSSFRAKSSGRPAFAAIPSREGDGPVCRFAMHDCCKGHVSPLLLFPPFVSCRQPLFTLVQRKILLAQSELFTF